MENWNKDLTTNNFIENVSLERFRQKICNFFVASGSLWILLKKIVHLAVLTTGYTKWVWRISKKVKYHKKCTGLFYTVRKQMEGKTSLFWLHARKLLQLTRKTKQIQRKLNEKKVKIPFFSFSCNDFTF